MFAGCARIVFWEAVSSGLNVAAAHRARGGFETTLATLVLAVKKARLGGGH